MEEVTACVKGRPRWVAVPHRRNRCLRDFRKRESSSSASLLTRTGAGCRLGSSIVRGFQPALAFLKGWVVRPVSAGGFLEAEQGAGLLVDSSLAAQVVPGVLHILLDDTA